MELKGRIGVTFLWWAWMPVLAYLYWLMLHVLFGGIGTWEQWWRIDVVQRYWLPGGGLGHPTGLFWMWVTIGLVGTGLILGGAFSDSYVARDAPGGQTGGLFWAVSWIAAALVFFVPFLRAVWDNDKDEGRYYNTVTTWHITSKTDAPASTAYLLRGAHKSGGGCAYQSPSDVHTCINVGGLSGIRSWEGRTSSYASASQMMGQAASIAPKVDAWEETITYLYGKDGTSGIWTAVLDGSGKATPTYGIASWDGASNRVRVACRFASGTFDRAFHGERGNSLRNLLAEKFPDLVWDDDDVWGYCKHGKPVIVVPVQREIGYKNRSVITAAGVLVVTGDHGVHAVYRPEVKAGDLPGPVYPEHLSQTQRQATAWAAGRKWHDRASFGYKPTVDDVQAGNTSEYLLRGPDHHLYYVTPLTPNASKSQAFIAYAVSPADSVENGRLNRLDVYVLPDGDPNTANLNTLTNKATDAVRTVDPTFLNTGGKLEEFTPLGNDMWRVFGVRRGLTEFYVDLSIVGRVEPHTVNVSRTPDKPGATTTNCGTRPSDMSDKELANCLGALGDELRRRDGH
ncbi:hypothetical protein [Streptomyces odontomachi]|uniref:hypothetical protein n=1 Tax=Streptomyces odontomachi TaxID=2944940 RepID=UPI002109C0FD|nr:hypothetical protein [Streptomyces sp. ODS25]